jgi:hypothetical protein
VHACTGDPENGLFKEEPARFGTRVMFSDARNQEIVYAECPGSHPGHKPIAVLLKYAVQYQQHTGDFQASANQDDMTVFTFLPDTEQTAAVESQVLYNHDPDHVIQTLKTHGTHGLWVPDLGLAQLDHPRGEGMLLSFSLTPVNLCSLPLR